MGSWDVSADSCDNGERDVDAFEFETVKLDEVDNDDARGSVSWRWAVEMVGKGSTRMQAGDDGRLDEVGRR